MFQDRPDCIKLADKVFVFKKILNPELVKQITEEMDSRSFKGSYPYEETVVEWYYDKVTPIPNGLLNIWEQISELIYPEYIIHPSTNLLAVRPGDNGMFCHTDSPGRGCELMLTQPDVWSTCCIIDWGVVGYFGEFEGGAVYYPKIWPDGTVKSDTDQMNQDLPCLEYTPEPGDVVIHGSCSPYDHGVREVTSGTRYAFSNFSLKREENPGSFYTYRTPEYFEVLGNRTFDDLHKWMTPLFESETVKRIRNEKESAKIAVENMGIEKVSEITNVDSETLKSSLDI